MITLWKVVWNINNLWRLSMIYDPYVYSILALLQRHEAMLLSIAFYVTTVKFAIRVVVGEFLDARMLTVESPP